MSLTMRQIFSVRGALRWKVLLQSVVCVREMEIQLQNVDGAAVGIDSPEPRCVQMAVRERNRLLI